MGLDMYLYKKHYVKNWEHIPEEKQYKVTVKQGGKPAKHIDTDNIVYIVEDAGYWRKANAIHQWFVDNVQSGNDDCGTYYVSSTNLKQLLNLVNEVLLKSKLIDGKVLVGTQYKDGKAEKVFTDGKIIADPTTAEDLLPTQSGFFFGGVDFDENYYQDLLDTKAILEKCLQDEEGDYEYTSSW